MQQLDRAEMAGEMGRQGGRAAETGLVNVGADGICSEAQASKTPDAKTRAAAHGRLGVGGDALGNRFGFDDMIDGEFPSRSPAVRLCTQVLAVCSSLGRVCSP